MKKHFFILLASLASLPAFAQLEVKEHTLSNGLRVWLNEDNSQPVVVGAVVVNAGGKDSPGTGIPHYFEHMMFKGTERIGTIDYAAEKPILDSIRMQYDSLAAATDEQQRKAIQQTINAMSIRAAKYVIPNDFDRLIARYGGSGLNAYTSYDQTVYHNSFQPAFVEQWARLASERLLNPVFRLFQSELETVYEERNMAVNQLGYMAFEKGIEAFFAPHPYAQPLIGTGENLKNPRLSQMEDFYKKYYVASNMGLILCGDFKADEVLPVLEAHFSRLPAGEPIERNFPAPRPFKGREEYVVKFPIPILKAAGIVWRGPGEAHADAEALKVMALLLSNENQTGLLDGAVNDNEILVAAGVSGGFEEHGAIGVVAVPNLPFGSEKAALKIIERQVARLKAGDFADSLLQSVKLELSRDAQQQIEDIPSRASMLTTLFTRGSTLEEHTARVARIGSLTKDDIVALARKYLTDDCLVLTKKTGNQRGEQVEKPDFEPIVPGARSDTSAFARELATLPLPTPRIRFIDFDNDVRIKQLSPLVTLYAKTNPINDIFTLKLLYRRGEQDDHNLQQTAEYLSYLGTDSLSFEQFRSALQQLGATLYAECSRTRLTISITGFDDHFDETIALVDHFLQRPKADEKKLRQLVQGARIGRSALSRSADGLSTGLEEKVLYGDRSTFIDTHSPKEVKQLTGADLFASLREALRAECDIHYCGTLPLEQVARGVEGLVRPGQIVLEASPVYREPASIASRQVWFVHKPGATQAIIRAYVPGEAGLTQHDRTAALFYTFYFGADMSSILFQEIRELRSFAYGVYGKMTLPPRNENTKRTMFQGYMSTQNDKLIDALRTYDSLLTHLPLRPERIPDLRVSIASQLNAAYPVMRDLSERVASMRHQGATEDTGILTARAIPTTDMQTLSDFHAAHIAGKPVVYLVVGDRRKIDMEALAQFGSLTRLKPSDLVR